MNDSQQQTQIFSPSPTKIFTSGVIAILILLILGEVVFAVDHDFTLSFLVVSAHNIIKGRVWQLVTYPFISGMMLNLIFNGLMVLFVGSAIEREWRTASFLLLWIVISVVCGLIWVAVNLVTGNNFYGIGASGCTYGLIATMGLLFRDRLFFVLFATIKCQHLVLILIAIGILMNISTPINLIWVLGAPVAYVYVKLRWSMVDKCRRSAPSAEQGSSRGFVDID
jgi:membrane associated rhomboid family serine protease